VFEVPFTRYNSRTGQFQSISSHCLRSEAYGMTRWKRSESCLLQSPKEAWLATALCAAHDARSFKRNSQRKRLHTAALH
jgi:hypothetical protein